MAGAATHIHMAGLCLSSALAARTARWNVMVKRTSHMISAKPKLQDSNLPKFNELVITKQCPDTSGECVNAAATRQSVKYAQ